MKANHVHVGVRDLPPALAWLERVWELKEAPELVVVISGFDSTFVRIVGLAPLPVEIGHRRLKRRLR